jgi:hypothetical protein
MDFAFIQSIRRNTVPGSIARATASVRRVG